MPFRLLGGVVRLQVQRAPLKPGTAPDRAYDTSPLVEVPALLVEARGVRGLPGDGTEILDVHHQAHPLTRDAKGRAGLTVMTVADYERLRARFGPHVVDGCAGEVALVEGERPVAGEDLFVETLAGAVRLTDVRVAKPCVEFTRWCLRLPPRAPADDVVQESMAFLDHGGRGFRARAVGHPVVVEVGARIWSGSIVPEQRAAEGALAPDPAGHPGHRQTGR